MSSIAQAFEDLAEADSRLSPKAGVSQTATAPDEEAEEASQLSPEDILQLDPDAEVSRVETLGLEWADKDAAASILEETKKTLLAKLTQTEQLGARATGAKSLSMAQAENNATANPQYESHLRQMIEARKEAHRAKVRYDMGRVKIDLMRSLVAARREEMRLGGFRT